MTNPNGRVIWEGPSNLDGVPIVVIATGFDDPSVNAKTGKMIQTWILLQDVPPHHAFKDGRGVSVCGQCPHAGYNNNTCYLRWYQAPLSVWNCYKRGNYAPIGQDFHLFDDVALRLGSAGDPAMVPAHVWTEPLLRARKHTAYTHQWRHNFAEFLKGIAQASCDGYQDFFDACDMGWKAFFVVPKDTKKPANVVHCAASHEMGQKTSCEVCHLCDGKTANVMIYGHGSRGSKLQLAN